MEKMNKQEVADKIDHEGGIIEALHYGLTSEEIEDEDLATAWAELEEFLPKIHAVADMLPTPTDMDPWQGVGPWL